MLKESTILIRVSNEDKETLSGAARRGGVSVTDYLLTEALSRAKREGRRSKPDRTRGKGAPTYFRALCQTASKGGSVGYGQVGYELARHLADHAPYEIDDDDWTFHISEFQRLAEEGDQDELWHWFHRLLPWVVDLVPQRRRYIFIEGVFECMEDDNCDWIS